MTDRYLNEQWDDFIRWTENKEKDTSIRRLVKYVVERNTASSELRLHLFCEAQTGDEELRQKLVKRYGEFQKLISAKISSNADSSSSGIYFARPIFSLHEQAKISSGAA